MKIWILVVAIAALAGCISGKRGRGTNVGTGSDEGGPWTRGETPALVGRP